MPLRNEATQSMLSGLFAESGVLRQLVGRRPLRYTHMPLERFRTEPCRHVPHHTGYGKCVAASDREMSGTRTYYAQTWIRSLVCRGCGATDFESLFGYCLSAGVVTILCPECDAVLEAYQGRSW